MSRRLPLVMGVVILGVGVVFQGVAVSSERVEHDSGTLWSSLDQVLEAALDVYTPISPVLGNSRCRTHGLLLRKGVREGQLWALHMVDASSKLPSGLLTGNLVQLGSVDQCLAVRHLDPEHGPITGQHCLVSLGAMNAMSAILMVEKAIYGNFNGTGLDEVEVLLSQARYGEALLHVGATWSLCVPASCSPGDLQRHLRATLPGRVQVRVSDLACVSKQSQESRPWGNGVLVVGFLLVSFTSLIVMGTAYDLLTDASTPRNQYLVALSAYTNGQSLLKITSSPDTLASFDGLRCISVLWTILMHHFLLLTSAPHVNYRSLKDISTDWTHLIVTNAGLGVDSMFLISGALVAINFFRDRERNEKFSLWRYYLNRYVRLTPALLVMLLISLTLLPGLSDAPFFNPNAASFEKSCAEYGWLSPLFLSNFFDPEHTCLPQTWSTSVDMHLFLLSPVLLFPLWRTPRLGGALLLGLGLVSTGAVFHEAYQNNLQPINTVATNINSVELNTVYVMTHLRATTWLIGVAFGYLLHRTKGRRDVLSGTQTALGWTACVLLAAYAFLSAHAYFQPGVAHDRVGMAVYVAAMRPAWALAVAWVLFVCERGQGGPLKVFLSWPGWQVPSRLCFAVFFTNVPFAGLLMMVKKTPQYYNDLTSMVEFFGLVVISVMAAIPLHLGVEAPCIRLYRLIMRRAETPGKKEL